MAQQHPRRLVPGSYFRFDMNLMNFGLDLQLDVTTPSESQPVNKGMYENAIGEQEKSSCSLLRFTSVTNKFQPTEFLFSLFHRRQTQHRPLQPADDADAPPFLILY